MQAWEIARSAASAHGRITGLASETSAPPPASTRTSPVTSHCPSRHRILAVNPANPSGHF
ncbi:hypothetical protein D3C83_273330 [compost metagenome]